MFSVSFRILVGSIYGTEFYVNGSAQFNIRLPKESAIRVRNSHLSDAPLLTAEVIECSQTKRDPNSYKWEIIDLVHSLP